MKEILVCLSLVVLSFSSCKEQTQVNLISGFVYQNCQVPLPNAEIALKTNVGGSFGDSFIIGSSISGADGFFSISYELEEDDQGTADLLLILPGSFEVLIKDIQLNVNLNLKLYRNNLSEVKVNLSGTKTFSNTDTLFYGLSRMNVEGFKVQPSNGLIDSLKVSVPNLNSGTTPATFYYGVGSLAFQLSKEALSIQDSTYNHIPLSLEGCGAIETVEMVID